MSKAVATRTIRFVRLSPTSFKSTVFRRTNSILSTPPVGGDYNYPIPDGGLWSDGIPDGEEILWASTRVFSSDGKYPQEDEWSTPRKMTDTADFDVEYSSIENPENPPQGHPNTNTEWSNESNPTTIWMATSKKNNGVWEDWKVSKIKGEKGAKGEDGDSANPNILYNTNFAKDGKEEWYIRKGTEGKEGKFGNKYVYAEADSTKYLDFLAQLIVDENNTKGISPSTWYTLSFWAKGTMVYTYFYDRGNPLVDTNEDYYVNGVNMGKNTHSDGECAHSINSENEWTFHSYTFKTKADIAYTRLLFRIPTNGHASISSIKFEEGMIPTPWCLSEYDRKGEIGPQGPQGEAGQSAFILDVDNEMIPVAVDINGKKNNNTPLIQITVNAFYGSKKITNPVFSTVKSSDVNLATLQSIDKKNGTFKIALPSNRDWSNTDKVTITVTAKHDVYGEATTGVSIVPVYPGADGITPTIYELYPTISSFAFHTKKDGSLEGNYDFSINLKKTFGGETTILSNYPDGYFVYAGIDKTNLQIINTSKQSLSANDVYSKDAGLLSRYYYIELWKGDKKNIGSIMRDCESLPILPDGKDGDKGEKGAILRAREWTDVPVGSLFMSGKQGEEFLDIAYYPSKNGEKIPYKCMKSHVKTSDNYPYGPVDNAEKNWQRAETTEFIATKLILAERIGADQIDVEELVVNKLETSRIENEPKIEIQDGMMNIFGNSGVANIKIGIVPDGEPNAGTAVLQFFDNEGRMKFDLGAGGLREINSATFVEMRLGFAANDNYGKPDNIDLMSNIKSPTPTKYYRYQGASTGDVNNGNIYTEKRTTSPKIKDGWYTQSVGAAIYGPHIITEEDILLGGIQSYDNFYYMRQIVKIIGGKMTTEQRSVYWIKEPDRETITKNKS